MREYLLRLVWGQWVSLGVAGHAAPETEPGESVDTEALILLTTLIGRYDQRLFDLMLDWLGVYGRLISVQRLQTLLRRYPWAEASLLSYVAEVCTRHGGDKRWEKLPGAPPQTDAQPLFLDIDSQQALFVARKDATALQHGWLRNEYISSGKIAPQLPQEPATLLLQLRGCVGMSARAEILLLLLSGVGRPPELVSRSAYAPSTVHEILSDMQLSGIIGDVSPGTRQRDYVLRSVILPAGIANLPARIHFPDWVHLFDGIGRLWKVLMNEKLASLSDKTFFGEVNPLMQHYILPASRRADFPSHMLRLIPGAE